MPGGQILDQFATTIPATLSWLMTLQELVLRFTWLAMECQARTENVEVLCGGRIIEQSGSMDRGSERDGQKSVYDMNMMGWRLCEREALPWRKSTLPIPVIFGWVGRLVLPVMLFIEKEKQLSVVPFQRFSFRKVKSQWKSSLRREDNHQRVRQQAPCMV